MTETILLRNLIRTATNTTWWVAHFWKRTFRVVLWTGLWMPLASHSEAGRGEMSQIPETGPIVKISLSTTLFHPRQTRKGALCCSKYRNCPLSTEWLFLWMVPQWSRCFSHYWEGVFFKQTSQQAGDADPSARAAVSHRHPHSTQICQAL